jgi:hypothetical protein
VFVVLQRDRPEVLFIFICCRVLLQVCRHFVRFTPCVATCGDDPAASTLFLPPDWPRTVRARHSGLDRVWSASSSGVGRELRFSCVTCFNLPDFTASRLIDRVRVLLLRADPPELSPGTAVTLTSLVVGAGDTQVLAGGPSETAATSDARLWSVVRDGAGSLRR